MPPSGTPYKTNDTTQYQTGAAVSRAAFKKRARAVSALHHAAEVAHAVAVAAGTMQVRQSVCYLMTCVRHKIHSCMASSVGFSLVNRHSFRHGMRWGSSSIMVTTPPYCLQLPRPGPSIDHRALLTSLCWSLDAMPGTMSTRGTFTSWGGASDQAPLHGGNVACGEGARYHDTVCDAVLIFCCKGTGMMAGGSAGLPCTRGLFPPAR